MRFQNIDVLRGVAALAVAFFHLSNLSGLSEATSAIGYYGFLGVEIFFVISGFILPYSLHVKNYRLTDYPTFILKRLLRLEPGYFATIAASIVITYAFFRILPDWDRLLPHFGYLNDILNHTWLVGIFWTLAIEFQFYFFLGIVYHFVATKDNLVFSLFALILIACAVQFSHLQLLPRYLGLFLVGILLFRYMVLKISPLVFVASLAVVLGAVYHVNGVLPVISVSLAALGILYLRVNETNRFSKVLLWLGAISYSIYLVHWPFGIPVVRQLRLLPFVKDYELLRVFIGMGFTVFCAYVFYRLIEKPSMNWSNRIRYKRRVAIVSSAHKLRQKSIVVAIAAKVEDEKLA